MTQSTVQINLTESEMEKKKRTTVARCFTYLHSLSYIEVHVETISGTLVLICSVTNAEENIPPLAFLYKVRQEVVKPLKQQLGLQQ